MNRYCRSPHPLVLILAVLKKELASAKNRHREAREQFGKIGGNPRQVWTRDKGLTAAAEQIRARKAHLAALTRMNEYLIGGTVPEHLKEKTDPVSN